MQVCQQVIGIMFLMKLNLKIHLLSNAPQILLTTMEIIVSTAQALTNILTWILDYANLVQENLLMI
jgi:hypothetical protein